MTAQPAKPRKRRRRLLLLIPFALLLILLAIPFLFTRSLVLHFANAYGLAPYSPSLASASLSPAGTLTLANITLHDPSTHQPFLQADTLTLSFSWSQLSGKRLRALTASGLHLHATDSLFTPAVPSTAPALPSTPAAPSKSWTLDTITLNGTLHTNALTLVRTTHPAYPFTLKYTPTSLHVNLAQAAESLTLAATLSPASIHGTAALQHLSLTQGTDPRISLKDATLQTTFSLDLANPASLRLDPSKLTIAELSSNTTAATALSADVSAKDQTLTFANLQATFAKGDFTGTLHFLLPSFSLLSAELAVQHLDQKQVALNLAPDRLEAEGAVSGTIALNATPAGPLAGTILLTSDGPGRLQIKDEQVASALAQKLQTDAAPGLLPANFNTIVVDQLKNYPYTKSRLLLRAPEGTPLLVLYYTRDPVKEGEPGYGIQTELGGQKLRANYTLQLPGLALALKGKTLEQLLTLATGLTQPPKK